MFLLPVAFVQRTDEPGFQAQTRNFRTTFTFLFPELVRRGIKPGLVSLNNNVRQVEYGWNYLQETGFAGRMDARLFRRTMGRGHWFHQSLQFLMNLARLFRVMKRSSPRVFYGYNDVGALYGAVLKLFFSFRLVYDMRGDRLDEMKEQGAPQWRISVYRVLRKYTLRAADLVFTVSRDFEERDQVKQHLPKFNFFDARRFYFDASEADEMRRQLGLEDRFVLVYSGTDKFYQMIPAMVAFFARFREYCPEAFLMINTPRPSQIFKEELEKHRIPPTAYGMFHPDPDSLNRYQMVADMGLLLREDRRLNHKAFPTKFSEYLGSGVPVLITPYVHSLPEMVKGHGLGEIWNMEQSPDHIIPRMLEYRNNQQAKERCAAYARQHLSWQSKAPRLAERLESMVR